MSLLYGNRRIKERRSGPQKGSALLPRTPGARKIPLQHRGSAAQTGMQEVNVNDLLNEAMTRKPDVIPFWRTEFERIYKRAHRPFFNGVENIA
jgi:hypothetical protein